MNTCNFFASLFIVIGVCTVMWFLIELAGYIKELIKIHRKNKRL